MRTRYKCGRELPGNQIECDPPCVGEEQGTIYTEEQIAQAIKEYAENTVPIDWEKVTTVNDLKEIFRVMMFDDKVLRGSPAYRQLRRFLKENNPHD